MFSWKVTVARCLLLMGGSVVMGLIHNHVFSQQGIELGRSPLVAVSGVDEVRFIDLKEAEIQWKADATFVDARPEEFYLAEGHIKNALSLPNQDFETAFSRAQEFLPRQESLVIYCSGYGCEDSAELAGKLMGKGYLNVFVYEGGWPEWSEAGLPVELPAGEME